MAKRRLNVPLVILASVVGSVLVAAVVYVAYRKFPKDPTPYILAGEKEESSDPAKAAENYATAYGRDRRSDKTVVWALRAGDIYWALGRGDDAALYYNSVSKKQQNPVGENRLVRLLYYRATLAPAESVLETLLMRAEALIQMDSNSSIGHEAAAWALMRLNRPGDAGKAWGYLETLRKIDPNNPVGHFYAARLRSIASTDTSAPKQDLAAADTIMAFVPEKPSDELLARFRLYQALYQSQRFPADYDKLSTEKQTEVAKALTEKVRSIYAQITVEAGLTRGEQDRLAQMALRMKDYARAEKIYQAWKNDLIAALREAAGDSAVPQAALERIQAMQPVSVMACLRLAEIYSSQGQSRAADLEQIITTGLNVEPNEKSWLVDLTVKRPKFDLMIIQARQLVNECLLKGADFGEPNRLLSGIRKEYGEMIVEQDASFQTLAGQVAARLGDVYVAQRRLESAMELIERRPLMSPDDRRNMAESAMYLVDVYRVLNQFGKARELLESKLVRDYGNNPQVQLTAARLAADVRDLDRATQIVEGLLKNADIKGSFIEQQAKELRAQILRQEGNFEGFVREMGDVKGQADSAPQFYREAALAINEAAELHKSGKPGRDDKLALATTKLNASMDKDKAYWPPARALALVYLDGKKKDEAIKVLDRFIKDNPGRPSLDAMVFRKAIETNDPQEIRKYQADLAQQNETPFQRERRLAEEAAAAGDKDGVVKHLSAAEKLVAPNELTFFHAAAFDYMLRIGNVEQAQVYLRNLKDANADGLGGLSYEGRLLLKEAKWSEAIAKFNEVLKLRRADSDTRLLLATAMLNGNAGSVDDVIRIIHQAIDDNPLNRNAWRELVRILDGSGQKSVALAEATRGLTRLGGDPYLEQVRLDALATDNPGEAISTREQMAKARPGDTRNLLVLASLHFRQKQPEKAETRIAEAMKLVAAEKPADRLAFTAAAASIYLDAGKAQAGQDLLAAYIKDLPDDPYGHVEMGRFLRRNKQLDQAAVSFARALEKKPDPAICLLQADFYRECNKGVECLSAIDRALELKSTPAQNLQILLRKANYQVDFGRLDDAGRTIDEIKKGWAGNLDAIMLEGYLNMRKGKWAAAQASFEDVISKRPETANAYYHKAKLLYRMNPGGNLNTAIATMEQALKYDPNLLDGQPNRDLADWYLQKNDPARALIALRTQLRRKPDDASARLQLIRILDVDRTRDRDLDAELQLALQLFPEEPAFQYEMGRISLRRGQPAEAERALREALKRTPKGGSDLDDVIATQLAEALGAQKKWDALATESEQWIKDLGGSAALYMLRARALAKLNRPADMTDAMNKAIEASKGNPPVLVRFSMELRNMLGEQAARAALTQSVDAHPDKPVYRLARAFMACATSQPDAAVEECRALSEKYTSGEEALRVQLGSAIICQQTERFTEAAAAFERYIKLAETNKQLVLSNYHIVLNNYAYLLADNLNQAAKAVPLAETAADRTGRNDPQVLDTLGWCLIQNGEVQRGIDVLEEALQGLARVRRELPVVYYHLAVGYQRINKLDNARDIVRKALKALAAEGDAGDPGLKALRRQVDQLAASLQDR